ncbi:FecR family protein [Pseudomonas rubra]|uniref:FecR domain-containing protein n=1 Tax=Pseudomonas rubra TaxID=2942627 RepID=A0ABT5PAZ0_9PSED|nr:FecR domain-containing protein [Pseudomonas rubra]MDD1015198.1 FecR domain-containing protein [Pseudomonas rubra]MDD1037852.1 FecR domain-containing protein [Pseudomonas rubra]MDD1152820.1 FecR domain-containing protein [Pseudomonas rubra]
MSEGNDLSQQAAEWLVLLSADDAAEREHSEREYAQWKQLSPAHAEAAQGMERLLASLRGIRQAPEGGRRLHRLIDGEMQFSERGRRNKRLGAALGIGLMLLVPGWLAWQHYPNTLLFADLDTGPGQWQETRLEDGSRLTLAGGSAVNLHFSASGREVQLLRGAIRVDVAADAQRPFLVVTGDGSIRALGTRFVVTRQPDATDLSMLESTTLARPSEGPGEAVVSAGQQLRIRRDGLEGVQPIDVQATDQAWQQHRLLARGVSLPEVLEQLGRQYAGVLSFDREALAQIQVFASLPLDNPQRALQLLEASLPIEVSRLTPWITRINLREK